MATRNDQNRPGAGIGDARSGNNSNANLNGSAASTTSSNSPTDGANWYDVGMHWGAINQAFQALINLGMYDNDARPASNTNGELGYRPGHKHGIRQYIKQQPKFQHVDSIESLLLHVLGQSQTHYQGPGFPQGFAHARAHAQAHSEAHARAHSDAHSNAQAAATGTAPQSGQRPTGTTTFFFTQPVNVATSQPPNADNPEGANQQTRMHAFTIPVLLQMPVFTFQFFSSAGMFDGQPHTQGQPGASECAIKALPQYISTHNDKELGECGICLDAMSSSTEPQDALLQMPCGHIYHGTSCLIPWLKNSNTCPACRYEIKTDNPEYNAGVDRRNSERTKPKRLGAR